MKEEFKFDQNIEIHPKFSEYSLDFDDPKNKSHEAGFDAMMTGILWMKMQTLLSSSNEFDSKKYDEKYIKS